MSWFFKGIALTTLAACGFYALHVTEGDRNIVERLMRAADGAERRADVLGTGGTEHARTRLVTDNARDGGPAATSKALTVRPDVTDRSPPAPAP